MTSAAASSGRPAAPSASSRSSTKQSADDEVSWGDAVALLLRGVGDDDGSEGGSGDGDGDGDGLDRRLEAATAGLDAELLPGAFVADAAKIYKDDVAAFVETGCLMEDGSASGNFAGIMNDSYNPSKPHSRLL